jgi:hypothetical protein
MSNQSAELTTEQKVKTVAFVLALIFVVWWACSGDGEEERKANLTPEEARKEELSKLFSGWDGSLPALTSQIKNAMNDPDSYDHVETVYWDMKDHLIVQTTFRGKNKFGGVVKNSVKAKVDLLGNVIGIIDQSE